MADGAKSDHPAVQKQLDRLSMLSPGRDVLGLDRISEVLHRLDNPQNKIPPVFHVAGTNGKGSTCAFLRAAIEAEGLKAHIYTSPHLVRFNERIRIAGKLAGDEYLAELLARVLDISEDINPSFFEATTAAAFVAFAETPAAACVVEVGLGGRLDATNVVTAPVATGTTALGIDHESFLLSPEEGAPADPIVRIAWEKAGIAKKNVPLLTQKYQDDMTQAIGDHCRDIGASFLPRGQDWDAVIYENQLHYRDQSGKLTLPLPAMSGEHQADNAALAIAMLRHQNEVTISDSALKAAMGWAQWPGRMQLLNDGPLTRLLPSDTEIWIDGGHNVSAGLTITRHFAGHDASSIELIIGMQSNKDPAAILSPLREKLASVTVVPVPGHQSHSVGDYPNADTPIREAHDIDGALKSLKPNSVQTVLIAGSLYLVGEVLQKNNQIPD